MISTGLRLTIALAGLMALAACAMPPEYEPAVDMAGHTQAQYDFDLDVCREDAKEIDILKGTAVGVLAGTAIGAGAGSVLGDTGMGALTGLGGGAVAGAAAGSLYGTAERARTGSDPHAAFIDNCMKQRGYVLLAPKPDTAGTDESAAPGGGNSGGKEP